MNPNSPWRRVAKSFLNRDDSAISTNSKTPVTVKPKRRMSSVMSTASVRKSKHDGFIKINQYIVEKTLGKGSFATVKLCRDSVTNEKYAVKQMNKRVL
jgi:serine/threonine protein kinase